MVANPNDFNRWPGEEEERLAQQHWKGSPAARSSVQFAKTDSRVNPNQFTEWADPDAPRQPKSPQRAALEQAAAEKRYPCKHKCGFTTVHADRLDVHEKACATAREEFERRKGSEGGGVTKDDIKAAVLEAQAPVVAALENLAAAIAGKKLPHKAGKKNARSAARPAQARADRPAALPQVESGNPEVGAVEAEPGRPEVPPPK